VLPTSKPAYLQEATGFSSPIANSTSRPVMNFRSASYFGGATPRTSMSLSSLTVKSIIPQFHSPNLVL